MFIDEDYVLGFFNFAFSMQIKNFTQPFVMIKKGPILVENKVVFVTLAFYDGLS